MNESDWTRVFLLSPVNGADYREPQGIVAPFPRPIGTWFQARLDKVRAEIKSELYDHSE